jgi:hypothetical protein
MTIAAERSGKHPKSKKTFAERLLERVDRGAAKIPKEDWDVLPTDGSLRVEDHLEGKL